MLVSEGNGFPIGIHITCAQPHEITLARETLESIRVPQKRGRPRNRPQELVADKAYDSHPFRQYLRKRGIKPSIPLRKRRKVKKGRPAQVGASYGERWKIERCFAWMDNCRRLLVRYDSYVHMYKAFCFVALILWSINRILK
ncbi:IS5 family transposase [Desmospora profundinema]|uniref:Transposase n=1 Tax=Desmospora profundinema TaxID=1571184 RepID=A0ABU1ITZ9_9BACL|nr:IS5 family transposase [Desmospora profundinema]MDR6227634.1 transposase [Desmospora profundinema]